MYTCSWPQMYPGGACSYYVYMYVQGRQLHTQTFSWQGNLCCVYEWSSLWYMHKLCSMVPNEWSSLSCMHIAYLKANITTVHSAVCNSQPALSCGCQTHRHWCLLFHFYGSYNSECILHLRVETVFCYVDPKFFSLLLLEKHVPLEEMKVHVSMAFPINTLTILFLFNTTFYNSIKYAYKSSIQ